MPIVLRPYQTEILDKTRALLREGCKSVLIQSATGSGKTAMLADMFAGAQRKGTRAYFMVHRQELIHQAVKAFNRVDVKFGVISPDYPEFPQIPIQVASVPTLVKRLGRYKIPGVAAWDECFPAGTLVDGIPIENLKVGSLTRSYNHKFGFATSNRILELFSREYFGDWYRVTTSSGKTVVCTEGHPFFTREHGYIPAKLLTRSVGKVSLLAYEMPILQEKNPSETTPSKASVQILQSSMRWSSIYAKNACGSAVNFAVSKLRQKRDIFKEAFLSKCIEQEKELLFKCLPPNLNLKDSFGHNDTDESLAKADKFNPNEKNEKQPAIQARSSSQDVAGRDWPDVPFSWRKRKTDKATVILAQGHEISDGVFNRNRAGDRTVSKPSIPLQGGSGDSRVEIGNRSGRRVSQEKEVDIFGCQEDEDIEQDGLESVEVYKRGDRYKPAWVPSDNRVYNLHVEENNNYFANKILVHNCAHCAAASWGKVYQHYSSARHIGLTATPERLDGKGLDEYFSTMVQGPPVAWLIEQGYLAKFKYYVPESPDLEGVRVKMGDYVVSDLAEKLDKPSVVGRIVDHYKKFVPGKLALVFGFSVENSKHIAAEFNANGIPAFHLDGKTDSGIRKQALEDFSKRKIMVITNVNLFTEGTDIEMLDCVILGAPTQSKSRYLQMVGRGLRTYPGKEYAVILDCVNNVRVHGLPDEERKWSLTGRAEDERGPNDEVAIKMRQCVCGAAMPPWATSCKYCGHVFPVVAREVATKKGELVELDRKVLTIKRKQPGTPWTEEELVQIAIGRKLPHPNAWAKHAFQEQQRAKLAKGRVG